MALLCESSGREDAAPHGKWKGTLLRVSQAALAAGNGADAFSSLARPEINPLLGRGRFDGSQIAIKTAIVGGVMLGQEIVARKAPAMSRAFAVSIFGKAGYFG